MRRNKDAGGLHQDPNILVGLPRLDQLLSRLGPDPAPRAGSGSAWDQRDKDTWIDRL